MAAPPIAAPPLAAASTAAPPAPARVLYVSHETEFGGAERSLLSLLRALDRARYAPQLATSGDGPLSREASALGVRVHDVAMRFASRPAKMLGLWRAVRSLRTLIAAERIALVHANTLIAGYVALRAARAAGVPCVWHVRDVSYPWLGRVAARRATWRIANSRATAAALGGGDVTVVYNGVDPSFFAPHDSRAAVRAELGVPANERLIAIAGRLDPWKGHRVLLDAAALLRPQLGGVSYVVLGDVAFARQGHPGAGYRAELERRAAELGLAPCVRFVGWREDVARWLAGCDLLVHPSAQPEPFGRAIAEAQATGLPVVASNHGGVPELIEDGVDGILVAPRDPNALAETLARLLRDDAARARIGAAGRARAMRQWTAAAHARAVEAVYAQVLGQARSS